MKLRTVTALALALLCLLLCACSAGGGGRSERVTLWCLESDPLRLPLEKLAQEYNRSPGGRLQVKVRSFPDEESLAAAFDTARPDLLLCSHDRAWTLEQQELLRDLRSEMGEAAPDYPESLLALPIGVGEGYYPLGVQVTLLCVREELQEDWEDLPALCEYAAAYGRERGEPFFTADSFGDLIFQELFRQGAELHGDLLRDREEEPGMAAYNALAACALDRGLALSEHEAVTLAASGALPCAAGASTEMTRLPAKGFAIRPLPGLEKTAPLPGVASGIAVTAREGRDLDSAAAFLSWLFSEGRASWAALEAGLLPSAVGAAPEAESPLEALLLELGADHELWLLSPEGDYLKNRAAFERELRAELLRFL